MLTSQVISRYNIDPNIRVPTGPGNLLEFGKQCSRPWKSPGICKLY